MQESKGDSIRRIVKLVETVNQGAYSFASTAAAIDADPLIRRFAEKIYGKVAQFEFELRTELQRLAAESTAKSHPRGLGSRVGFETILESYRQALAGYLTPHARAMINRQLGEMERAHAEFSSIVRAA